MAKVPDNPGDLTDQLLESDPDIRRLTAKIRRRESKLRKAAGLEHFRFYLAVEEAVNERLFALVDRVWTVARAGRGQRPFKAASSTGAGSQSVYSRNTFKDRVGETLGEALLEFYKAQLAEKNGYTKWVKHWRAAVRTLLTRSLVVALLPEIRGVKNGRKDFDAVVLSLKRKDGRYRRAAVHQITRDFRVKQVKKALDDADTAAFWSEVQTATEAAFLPLPRV